MAGVTPLVHRLIGSWHMTAIIARLIRPRAKNSPSFEGAHRNLNTRAAYGRAIGQFLAWELDIWSELDINNVKSHSRDISRKPSRYPRRRAIPSLPNFHCAGRARPNFVMKSKSRLTERFLWLLSLMP
jgi:hypothetical protein